jgi:hypothetical protein
MRATGSRSPRARAHASRVVAWLLLALAGCTSTPPRTAPDTAPDRGAGPASDRALRSPARDFRWFTGPLPPILVEAAKAPYAPPPARDCTSLAAQVSALDAVLGADADVTSPVDDKEAARWLASGVKSLIPYFGWMRRLTGAERRERRAIAAHAAGAIRRAYLKGLGEAGGCTFPAAPARNGAGPDQAGNGTGADH